MDTVDPATNLIIRELGQQDYHPIWQRMVNFTNARTATTTDEFWALEHHPVFTQGQAGKPEHLLNTGDIPVIQVDRGGQVTYHGPGQLVVYLMIDLKRKKLGARDLVTHIENALISTLRDWDIDAHTLSNAPGVYVDNAKIASLGLRIRKGCSFHGLALNVAMDMEPFLRINPCGYSGMPMVQLSNWVPDVNICDTTSKLMTQLTTNLAYTDVTFTADSKHE